MGEEPEKSKWGNTFTAHAMTAVLVTALNQGGQYIISRNDSESETQTFNVKLLQEQNRDLQEQIKELRTRVELRDKDMLTLRTRVATLEAENIRLKMEVATKTGYPKNNLRLLIDALPIPAWAKEIREVPEPAVPDSTHSAAMIGINDTYAYTYCVTDPKYRGQSDFKIHNYELAKAYYDNDMRVFENKNDERIEELVLDCQSGEYVTRVFYKYHHQLTDGTHVVGGIQVSE